MVQVSTSVVLNAFECGCNFQEHASKNWPSNCDYLLVLIFFCDSVRGPFRVELARHVAGKDVALLRLREVAARLAAVLGVRQRLANPAHDLVLERKCIVHFSQAHFPKFCRMFPSSATVNAMQIAAVTFWWIVIPIL